MSTTSNNAPQTITCHYTFIFDHGDQKKFHIVFNKDTMNLIQEDKSFCPEWTLLKFYRCPHCPLDEQLSQYCPVAVSFIDVVEIFQGAVSYENVKVLIETGERTYSKQTDLQEGLSSLIGLYMVTSGCPVMEKLKPMVSFHLPFATEKETMFRVISMYLLAQYFISRKGAKPDWELSNLVKIYEDIRLVNKSFGKRLAHIKIEDSNINALVRLDCFADAITFSISKNILDEIEPLFSAYL